MSRILKDLEQDIAFDDLDDEDRPAPTPKKKCGFCGHRGHLVQDVDGLACGGCNIILVDKSRN